MWNRVSGRIGAAGALAITLGVLLAVGIGFALTVWWSTWRQPDVSALEICFTSDCVTLFKTKFAGVVDAVTATIAVLVGVATAGGIVVALMSYKESVNANALSNHIAHLTLFRAYLEKEIAKRSRLKESSIDIHAWYFSMFPRSRSGSTAISASYIDGVRGISRVVSESNARASQARTGSFRFLQHQDELISALRALGINISRQPRMDFYEVEGEVFELIDSINVAFSYSSETGVLPLRNYR